MALGSDGRNIALEYRGHLLTAWKVEEPELVGRYPRVFDDSTQSNAAHTWEEITELSEHPYAGNVIGPYLEGVTHIMMSLKRFTQQ